LAAWSTCGSRVGHPTADLWTEHGGRTNNNDAASRQGDDLPPSKLSPGWARGVGAPPSLNHRFTDIGVCGAVALGEFKVAIGTAIATLSELLYAGLYRAPPDAIRRLPSKH
jgi:hypothetical protein